MSEPDETPWPPSIVVKKMRVAVGAPSGGSPLMATVPSRSRWDVEEDEDDAAFETRMEAVRDATVDWGAVTRFERHTQLPHTAHTPAEAGATAFHKGK